jgi:radical SAM protein with 4Fe4S-binding SPASM domain
MSCLLIDSHATHGYPKHSRKLHEGEMRNEAQKPRCHMPWQQMMIDANGNVHPCAYRNNYNNPSPHPPCGNLNENTLLEIWNGEEYQQLREDMARGDLESAGCANCLALKQGQPLQLQRDLDCELETPPTSAYAKNIQLKRQEVKSGATVLKSLPTVVYYTPTHHCNLRCIHCYQDISRDLTVGRKGVEQEVEELLPTLDRIIAGGGEPLLLPIWKRFINNADLAKNPYLEFATTTNATRISGDVLTGLSRFKRVAITVSMDGCTKEIFEPIRLRGKFEEVVHNLDRLIQFSQSHPSAHISVTFSVMKANFLGLPDLIRFCAAKGIGFNLLPVIAYPVDQSLRSFNNPEKQMQGWKDSLDESRNLFERHRDQVVSASLADVRRGHFDALEGHIPWHLLKMRHYHIHYRLPDALLASYQPAKNHQELIMGFFPLEKETWRECLYYSQVIGKEIDVCLPEGEYKIGLFPRNAVPHISGDWLAQVVRKTTSTATMKILWGGNALTYFQRAILNTVRNQSPSWLRRYMRAKMPSWLVNFVQARLPH